MPFRFGIAEMTEVPHLILQADLEVDGRIERGLAAESLAPKWFTKDPDTSLEEDRLEVLDAIERACGLAMRSKVHPPCLRSGGSSTTSSGGWGRRAVTRLCSPGSGRALSSAR
jgi:hypothetical protein